jgi:hypothetical protein
MLHGELISVCAEIPTKLGNALLDVAVDKVTAGRFKVPDYQNSGFSAIPGRQLTFSEFWQSERGSIPARV